MRKLCLIAALLCASITFAQSNNINYKALIKDANNTVVANQSITVQFTILQGVAQTNVYRETHTPTTDANGIIIINIGEGTVDSGVFANIDWSSDDHFLNTQINLGSGLTDMGTTEFNAVPYALSAKTAANVTGLETLDEGNGNGLVKVGRDPASYGNVGDNAVDLSYSDIASTTIGATGELSTAMGYRTEASSIYSTAMGVASTASGSGSTAMGENSTASGNSSTAMGLSTAASGSASTAMGQGTIASGYASTAIGNYTTALGSFSTTMGVSTTASGSISTAMGFNTKSESENSFALGYYNVGGGNPTTNIGTDPLFEIGNGNFSLRSNALTVLKNGTITAPSFDISEITDNKALITKEYADTNLASTGLETINEGNGNGLVKKGRIAANYANVGENAVDLSFSDFANSTLGATGFASTAIGVRTEASGDLSTAMGSDSVASGHFSTAMGVSSVASGSTTIAMGSSAVASGDGSIAMGSSAVASGDLSTAMGDTSTASGIISTAMGFNTTASGFISTAMGFNTTASGTSSTASGRNTIAESYGQTTLGVFNVPTIPNSATAFNALDRLLVVGNGESGATSDALVILKNGNATLAGSLTQNSDRRLKTDITDLEYGLNTILQLNPVSYYWKKHRDSQSHRSLGLIAQDVQPILKELISVGRDENQTLSLDYVSLVPVLIKGMQEQQDIIDAQAKKIEELEKKEKLLLSIEARLTALETAKTNEDDIAIVTTETINE